MWVGKESDLLATCMGGKESDLLATCMGKQKESDLLTIDMVREGV